MARSFTGTLLVTRVRERTDRVGEDPVNGFVTDTEILRNLSAGIGWLGDLLADAGEGFAETEETISIAAGASSANLSASHRSTLRVDRIAGTTYAPLERAQVNDLAKYGSASGVVQAYRLVGSTIKFYPPTAVAVTFRHLYIPAPTDLTSGATTVDGIAGWEELPVEYACRAVRIKCQQDHRPHDAAMAAVIARIEEKRSLRISAQPGRIVDVDDCAPRAGDWVDYE
jgi:hypothetical protein